VSTPPRFRIDAAFGVLIVALALGLRLQALGDRSFCHPENYVPGLPVPSWVHLPPERVDVPSLAKSLLRDSHPPLYYVVMLPWVDVFGYTEWSIRLPSVLLGTASVLLLWRIALREAGRWTALAAALLLALHGQQIYWSQTARVYAFAIFLGLLSTFLLWKALEDGRRRWRIAYGLSTIAALWTHVYCWPLVFCQVIWSSLRAVRTKTPPPLLATQIVSLILSMPVIALAIYLYRPIVSTDPPLEYFELGYLFWTGAIFPEASAAPFGSPLLHGVTLALGIAAVALGILARPRAAVAIDAPPAPAVLSFKLHVVTAVLGGLLSAAIAGAAAWAFHPHTAGFDKVILVGCAAFALGAVGPHFHRVLQNDARRGRGFVPWLAARTVRLSPLLALLPFLGMLAGAIFEPNFLERGTMLYVPFLLLAVATGLTQGGRLRWFALPALAAVLVLHVLSIGYARASDHTLRDYRAFSAALESLLAPDDLLLITNEYSDPPLLFYMRNRYAQFVPSDWERAVAARTSGRVWIIRYEDQEVTPALQAAVAGLKRGATVTTPGARAFQFVR
jgi:4-amino-4-deoxy-L-arabinose transferase-like glycosyltransferase